MLTARGAHTATLLADQYVFIYGGRDVTGAPMASAEAFVPLGNFIAVNDTASFPVVAKAGHAAVRVASGDVLLVGGEADPEGLPDPGRRVPVLRFVPDRDAAGQYRGAFDAPATVGARTGASFAVLPDATVLVAGGRKSALGLNPQAVPAATDWVDSVELYTPCRLTPGPCE
jgi:hypothetical protein